MTSETKFEQGDIVRVYGIDGPVMVVTVPQARGMEEVLVTCAFYAYSTDEFQVFNFAPALLIHTAAIQHDEEPPEEPATEPAPVPPVPPENHVPPTSPVPPENHVPGEQHDPTRRR